MYETFQYVNYGSTLNSPYSVNNDNFYAYYSNFYIKRSHEKIADKDFFSNVFKSFKKTAKKYFADCKALVKKIDAGDYKNSKLIEIVEYYNANCN